MLIYNKKTKQIDSLDWIDNGEESYRADLLSTEELINLGYLPIVIEDFDQSEFEGDYEEREDGYYFTAKAPLDKSAVRNQQIEQMRNSINALRDEKSASGVYVEALGKWFDSDLAAYNNLLGFKAETDLNGDKTTMWACADNELIAFDREALKAVVAAIWEVKTHNHAIAIQHKMQMEQADNPLDYDYSQGWAKTYIDFVKEQQNAQD